MSWGSFRVKTISHSSPNEGREQARAVAETLKSLGFDRLVTSDLARARQTAEIIGSELDLALTADSSCVNVVLAYSRASPKRCSTLLVAALSMA